MERRRLWYKTGRAIANDSQLFCRGGGKAPARCGPGALCPFRFQRPASLRMAAPRVSCPGGRKSADFKGLLTPVRSCFLRAKIHTCTVTWGGVPGRTGSFHGVCGGITRKFGVTTNEQRFHAPDARSWRAFWSPDPILEPEDGLVHLRAPQQDPHRQPGKDPAPVQRRHELPRFSGGQRRQGDVRRH